MMERNEQIKRFYEEVIYTRMIKRGCTRHHARSAALHVVENLPVHSLILGPY